MSSLLAPQIEDFVAIDPDQLRIDEAEGRGLGVKFCVGSGEDLNFFNNVFDVIIFTLSLHHQNSVKALNEAKRVLKKGGSILVVEPVVEGEIEKLFSFLINENQAKLDAQQAINESGLRIDRSQNFTAEWRFDDIAELQKSLFDYYEMEYDIQGAEKILTVVGEKAGRTPIVIEDLMNIQLLSEPEGN
ncbi:MAG: hypothetical protein C0619_14085 [Desulfuromonas sp.]|nr:MAG: hypothetical protein C0619_14085 [Desulfuromonas sp.]